MAIYQLNIPDLNTNPYTITEYILNNKLYYFYYFWNSRDERAYLSIYFINDSEKIYLIKGVRLTTLLNISKNIYYNELDDTTIAFCKLDIDSGMFDYTQQNISTDFYISFSTGDNSL